MECSERYRLQIWLLWQPKDEGSLCEPWRVLLLFLRWVLIDLRYVPQQCSQSFYEGLREVKEIWKMLLSLTGVTGKRGEVKNFYITWRKKKLLNRLVIATWVYFEPNFFIILFFSTCTMISLFWKLFLFWSTFFIDTHIFPRYK